MTNNQQEKTDRKPNIWKTTKWAFKAFDVLRGPCIFEFFWHILTHVSPLNPKEIEAASEVFGPSPSRFNAIRVAEGRILSCIFRLNGGRSFVTFHTINFASSRDNSRERLADMVHEITHVYQFELVGSIYLWQAKRAQWKWGDNAYNFGTWKELNMKREKDWHFRDYCREQQAKMAEVYYKDILAADLSVSEDKRKAYEPYIQELKRGEL